MQVRVPAYLIFVPTLIYHNSMHRKFGIDKTFESDNAPLINL